MLVLELKAILIKFFVICYLSDLETYLDLIHEDLFNEFPGKLKYVQKVSYEN